MTEGEGSDPCLTGRDVQRLLYTVDLMLVAPGLSGGGTFMSGRRRELLSPSGGSFFLKLMPLKILRDDEAPLDEIPGDWSEALLLRILPTCACLGGILRDKSKRRVPFSELLTSFVVSFILVSTCKYPTITDFNKNQNKFKVQGLHM